MILWPFPGQPASPPPVHDLPQPRFSVGDRVTTRWGRATVMKVEDWPDCMGDRIYHVRHDWSDAPPGFGHLFGEGDMTLLVEQPHVLDDAEVFQSPSMPVGAVVRVEQMELFR